MTRPAPDVTRAEPGTIIDGRYRLIQHLGEGGMGQVFVAEHLELGRRFALKVLRLERWSDELVARFRREAQALARLSTPHVAQVTDFGVADEVGPYYVMELVEGETLESRIEKAVLTADEAIRIGVAAATALAEVHAAGLVHRDLKPSNIALPLRGPIDVKLLDFGLAAAVDDGFLTRITKSQQVLGSLPYMPPEAFDGARPSPAMDLYALGVSLYEALSGALPFFAPSTAAMIHQIMTAPVPPLAQRSANVPPPLAAVLERLLAKSPADRYPDAASLAAALRALSSAPARAPAAFPPTALAAATRPLLPTVESQTPTPVQTAPLYGATGASVAPAPTDHLASGVRSANTRATTSTASIERRMTSPARFIALAFVAGLVLAAVAASIVVSLLNATDTEPQAPGAPVSVPTAVLPESVPLAPGAAAERSEGSVAVTDEEGSPLVGSAGSESEPESEPRHPRPAMRGSDPSVPAPAMPTSSAPAMTSMWRGDQPILDDSEFD